MGTVMSGLQAALLLARGRSEGLRLLEPASAAASSFWALPLTVPAALALLLIQWVEDGMPSHLDQSLALNLAGFVVGWLLFAVLSYELTRFLDLRARWAQFIAAWNWCNLVENGLLVLGCLPGLLGAPTILSGTAQLVALGWALWIEWFAIRKALQTNGLIAAWLVILDQSISLLLAALIMQLSHGS